MSHSTDATFADLAIHHRLAAGLSQAQLAAVASLSVRAICDVERGATRRPQRASVTALADGLGLTGKARDIFIRAARLTPPTRTQRTVRGSAPVPALVGRDTEIDAIAGLLGRPQIRLVTVTGVTGVGKSAVARHVADRFDETAVVDLRRVADPAGVRQAVAAAVELDPALSGRLLLLDGFRHGDDAAIVIADLLARHQGLRFLLTADSALRLRGEHVWPLEPLTPAATATLLAERMRAVRAGFGPGHQAVKGGGPEELGGGDVKGGGPEGLGGGDVIASLGRRLAGVPRAIELAALRLRTRDPEELDAELAVELGTGGPADVVRLMVAAAVARLPGREADTLAAVAAAPAGITPAALRLSAKGHDAEHVDIAVGALAALGLITVDDHFGRVHVGAIDPVAEILAVGPGPGRVDGVA
jgi:transcriptional regulator with XRE-family HTH domain